MRILLKLTVFLASFIISPAFADAVDEMLQTDRDFAAMAQAESVPAAFAMYAAEDVRMLPDGGAAYTGRDNMIERFANWPEDATLEWTPVEGMAGAAGDFGFTWGNYVFTVIGADGAETVEHGKYVSVWRREKDGAWKFVVDIGNSNPAPKSEN